jgi:hypothetical protein
MPSEQRDDPRDGRGPRGSPQGGAVESAGSDLDLQLAINALRARVDEEFRVAERLDSKQRQAFGLAAALFAVAQTVAFGSFESGSLDGAKRAIIVAAAVVAALVLVIVMHRLRNAEDLHDEDDVLPEAIVDWCNEADADGYVAVRLIREFSEVARRRAASNKVRSDAYDRVAEAARWSLIATGTELLIAVLLRI